MNENIIIGIDLAKTVFQLHIAERGGKVISCKKLTRDRFRHFMLAHEPCLVAMEACATAHYWARELQESGHRVLLIPPNYVKPFVKRHKNDAADARAIVTAALQPDMNFVEIKSAETQALTMLVRVRAQLINQRTQTVNALRGHLAEFGLIVPKGIKNIERFDAMIVSAGEQLPLLARDLAEFDLDRIAKLSHQIDEVTDKIKAHLKSSPVSRLLQTMPGIGPISAMIIEAFAPDMGTFQNGRDFSAWLGLIPLQHSTGGKTRLGRTAKMGQRDIRHTLITGAMSRIAGYARQKSKAEPWLQDKLDRKPKMVAAIALANKMARQLWAMLTKDQNYRTSGASPI